MTYQNYKLNKKKNSEEDVEKEKESEARLVRIEADVLYIRQSVDRTEKSVAGLEGRLDKVERDVEVLKSKD